PPPFPTLKPALNRRHRILYLLHILTCTCLPTVEESVDLDIVALNRLLRSRLDPEHASVVLSMLADIVKHQLRFARSPKPIYH
ncbi:MAG: hypothetical protein Q9164_005130, partial [Protoblastenia rupestris]